MAASAIDNWSEIKRCENAIIIYIQAIHFESEMYSIDANMS